MSDICFFAETYFRNQSQKFGIKTDDRRRHMYVIGKTGMGKTTMLENMVFSDVMNGHGLCYIDPHGDTAEKILDFIPSHRINDVIYFNPSDIDFPISFNVLESVDPRYKHLVASGMVGVFKKIWADSWGPRLEYILRNALLALLDHPDSTLLGVTRILVDKEFRKRVVANIKDPVVKSFWVNEFTKFNERTLADVISPIQNKVGQFLSTALIRNIVGQVKSSLSFREIMDSKKILILNLSKGRIGEDASALLGAMMITKLQLAAMSRVDIPEEQRQDFYLYVDEFQNFATESFAGILSEARKYRLNLIVAHQYVAQLDEKVADAIFGNVGTIVSFRIGAGDAENLVKEFTPFFNEEDFVNLPKFFIYLKLMIDGIASNPFSAKTLPPLFKTQGNSEKIVGGSRERYAKSREIVEDKIMRWSGHTPGLERADEPVVEKKGKYDYACKDCAKKFSLNVELDRERDIFCKECLEKKKVERSQEKQKTIVEKIMDTQNPEPTRPEEQKVLEQKQTKLGGSIRIVKDIPSEESTQKKVIKQERKQQQPKKKHKSKRKQPAAQSTKPAITFAQVMAAKKGADKVIEQKARQAPKKQASKKEAQVLEARVEDTPLPASEEKGQQIKPGQVIEL